MRVVADTNILVSAFLFFVVPRAFLDLGVAKAFTLMTSDVLLIELDEKLLGKFQLPSDQAQAFLSRLTESALVVRPGFELRAVPDDEDDNRVLECTVAGQADFIVSGDKHLLRLVRIYSHPHRPAVS